jgi:hypothetical protein
MMFFLGHPQTPRHICRVASKKSFEIFRFTQALLLNICAQLDDAPGMS